MPKRILITFITLIATVMLSLGASPALADDDSDGHHHHQYNQRHHVSHHGCWYHKPHWWHGKWIRGHFHCGNTHHIRHHRSHRSYNVHYRSSGKWDRVARCESGNNWHINTGNGHYGGLQFSHQTWMAYGGGKYAHNAHQATKQQQIEIAERTLRGQGWNAWSCAHAR